MPERIRFVGGEELGFYTLLGYLPILLYGWYQGYLLTYSLISVVSFVPVWFIVMFLWIWCHPGARLF
jgi:hypothetical protein